MVKTAKTIVGVAAQRAGGEEKFQSLSATMTKQPVFKGLRFWIVGKTPLITKAWSQKAKDSMLAKQSKAAKAGREQRNPQEEFESALYGLGDGSYGVPVTAIKNAIVAVAHNDKGIPKTTVMAALWLNAELVRVKPALAGAICDLPLVRVFGSKPEMREDMVRVGSGLNKTATLTWRPQFTIWAVHVTGEYNASVLSIEQISFLLQEAGRSEGLCEWRNSRRGMFGAFELADAVQEAEWDAFAAGRGPMPIPAAYRKTPAQSRKALKVAA